MGFFLGDKRVRQRTKLGVKYVRKYLTDKLLGAYYFDHSLSKPLDVLCEITYNCNLKCPTCFRWTSTPNKNEFGLEDWKDVVIKLKRWMGVFNLSFSGGEPFLRKDLVEICKFASEKGIVVSAVSNGSLIDRSLAKDIISSGLDALSLSLNSLDPEVHNMTRGISNSFNDVMTAIEHFKDRHGMRLTISTTVMKENIRDLVGLADFVNSKGLDGINFQPLMETDTFPVYDRVGEAKEVRGGKLYSGLGKDTEAVNGVFEQLVAMKGNGYPINNSVNHLRYMGKYLKNPDNTAIAKIPCKIGTKNYFIDPFGNVRICSVMKPIGNIARDAPQDIWNSVEAQRQRENIRHCHKACRLLNCNFKELDIASRTRRIAKSFKKKSL